MTRKLLLIFILMANNILLFAQSDYKPSLSNLRERVDFQNRKFGLFIHWGIYSLMGDGEWVMHNRNIPYQSYSKLAAFFYPYDFNAKTWVEMAKSAGIKYICITTRHHDGFSMFFSNASPYNIVHCTHYARDPLKELADACHDQGIKLFFYYSLLDWSRDDYGYAQPIVHGLPVNTDWPHYIQFMKSQLTELLTNYGEIAGIWFDGEWDRKNTDWHFDEVYTLIHKLQPQTLIGNNHHHDPRSGEDFQMFEKDLPGENKNGWVSGGVSEVLPLETCETINNSWGFNINDRNYKSVKTLINYLVEAAGRNANFLLNVGPMPNGDIQTEFKDSLAVLGSWLKEYGESIYDTRGTNLPRQPWGTITQKDKMLYIHIIQKPSSDVLFISGFNMNVKKAIALSDRKVIKFRRQKEGLFLYLEGIIQDKYDTIIQLQ